MQFMQTLYSVGILSKFSKLYYFPLSLQYHGLLGLFYAVLTKHWGRAYCMTTPIGFTAHHISSCPPLTSLPWFCKNSTSCWEKVVMEMDLTLWGGLSPLLKEIREKLGWTEMLDPLATEKGAGGK